ncbi:glycogen synthase GlgA [Lujinxingia litoralis]|uniref:Glycogen synthase n=1 Tax=Lujinxingia litoralis TaxID=2211119 RepID=A0A328CCU3_9DELT|nr:glycogen synthase GlgA [Lujinxingia litoralis]RAL23741.1 glycogen synthase GlgA [Lujinxingia litoralis]
MDLSRYIKTRDTDSQLGRRRLNVLFASSEVAPFSKTGGLADVAASLPQALARRGHNVSIVTPLYKHLDPKAMRLSRRLAPLEVPRKSKNQSKVEVTVWESRLDSGVRVFFIDAPQYFDRDGLYGYDDQSFEDNAERFAFFSRAVVELALTSPMSIDIIHSNDWHTGLVPIYGKHYYAEEFANTRFVMTIHNLAFQGKFDATSFKATGLPRKYNASGELLDDEGQLNYLAGALRYADLITTVSPTYAREIQRKKNGFGLHELLQERKDDLEGVLNGADYGVWSPDVDRFIEVRYSVETLNGKRQNKAHLQHSLGLPVRPTLPLVGMVSRLTEQKGVDLLVPAIRSLLTELKDEREGFQVIILGDGPDKVVKELKQLEDQFPNRARIIAGYDEAMAHRIQASADMLLIPSRFEPCGLTQIYAMRYGTVPVVHATGGLADTVVDLRDDPENGTGFVFTEHNADALAGAIERAGAAYRNYRKWRPLMIRAMGKDFSWRESAMRYEELFLDALPEQN